MKIAILTDSTIALPIGTPRIFPSVGDRLIIVGDEGPVVEVVMPRDDCHYLIPKACIREQEVPDDDPEFAIPVDPTPAPDPASIFGDFLGK